MINLNPLHKIDNKSFSLKPLIRYWIVPIQENNISVDKTCVLNSHFNPFLLECLCLFFFFFFNLIHSFIFFIFFVPFYVTESKMWKRLNKPEVKRFTLLTFVRSYVTQINERSWDEENAKLVIFFFFSFHFFRFFFFNVLLLARK